MFGLSDGFSLLELLIVIAILMILSAIAIPNYQDYLTRSRRGDAMLALQQLAGEQQRFRLDSNTFTSELGLLGLSEVSPDGYYVLSIPQADTSSYVARATPQRSQSKDGAFEIRSNGVQGWDHDNDFVFTCSWEDASRSKGC